jgi:hypothetical protein
MFDFSQEEDYRELTLEEQYLVNGGAAMDQRDQAAMAAAQEKGDQDAMDAILAKYETPKNDSASGGKTTYGTGTSGNPGTGSGNGGVTGSGGNNNTSTSGGGPSGSPGGSGPDSSSNNNSFADSNTPWGAAEQMEAARLAKEKANAYLDKYNEKRKNNSRSYRNGIYFDSIEEAVKDWAKTYADDSIHDDCEYISIIYSCETKEGIKYSYNEPSQGERKNATPNIKLEKGQKFVSKIHSHGSFDPRYLDEIPSEDDYDSMMNNKRDYRSSHIGKEYLVTPSGNLKSFDTKQNVITIESNLPVDPKSIFYSSMGNSSINLQTCEYYSKYIDSQTKRAWDLTNYKKDNYIPRNPTIF